METSINAQDFSICDSGKFIFDYSIVSDDEFARTIHVIFSKDKINEEFNKYAIDRTISKNSKDLTKTKKRKLFSTFENELINSISRDVCNIDSTITNVTNVSINNLLVSEMGSKDIEFDVSFSYTEKIKVPNLSEIEVKCDKYIPSDSLIDEYLEDIKNKIFDYIDSENGYGAKKNDVLIIDGEGYFLINGIKKRFKKANFRDMEIMLGSGKLIKDLEDGMIEMSVGNTKQIKVHFPSDYREIYLAGKEAFFDITVKKIKKACPVQDEASLLKKLNKNSLKEIKEEIKKMYEKRFLTLQDDKLRDLLYEIIQNSIELKTANHIIDLEKSKLKNIYKDNDEEQLSKMATDNIKLATFLIEIADKENIKVSDEDCSNRLFETYGGNIQQIRWFIEKSKTNPAMMIELRNEVLESKVFDHLKTVIKIIENEQLINTMQDIPTGN
ncbi:hypothetical protein GUI12_03040 [Anaplasmataceae bacterium AB001_6]|nr:hypothetical protein GUI12_03040 [Anaplasmataceae bacterium AB001_6]